MLRSHRALRRALIALLLAAAATATRATAQTRDPSLWHTDGIVYAMQRSGSTLYLGGTFTHLLPHTGTAAVLDAAGGAQKPFPRIKGTVYATAPDGSGGWYVGGEYMEVEGAPYPGLIHVLASGALDPAVQLPAGAVYSLLASGTTLYVGGFFDEMGGATRHNLAALDLTSGLATSWDPSPDGAIKCMALSGSTLYVGGFFANIAGVPRVNAAALNTATGSATAWAPAPDAELRAIAVNGATIYLGGSFTHLGLSARNYIGAVDATSGSVAPWTSEANSA
ncbi:MAG: hypothetical protein IT348_07515, partial [Candidatus Eisenbacteria bacterium]|nr:hypothetical protein [Candidatus Eisenbacteria bacterium]